MKTTSRVMIFCVLPGLFILAGCAAITQNMQSTQTRTMYHEPFVRDLVRNVSVDKSDIQVLPVMVDKGGRWFTPSLQPLASELSGFLVEKQWVRTLPEAGLPEDGAPGITFGAERYFSDDDKRDYSHAPMLLKVTQSSKKWRAAWQELSPATTPYTMIIKVETSAYQVKQKDWKGNKEIVLGTGYRVRVPWLTSLDDPVPVVHITGGLLDREGRVVRAGAEGIFVKESSSLESLFGISRLITKEDVERILHKEKRDDLPGAPLCWQVALQNLTAHLAGDAGLIIAPN